MQLIQITSPAQLTDIIQSLVTGSFEKRFKNIKSDDVITAFAFCTQGLNQTQLQTGIGILIEKAYCPDPALFRQWCLGNRDFKFDDEIADSYIGKHGALVNIKKWLDNPKNPISQAEKWAYDESYQLWQSIHSENDRIQAELAFKDFYTQKVAELVKNRVMCQTYTAPTAIKAPTSPIDRPRSDEELQAGREVGKAILASLGARFGQKQEMVA